MNYLRAIFGIVLVGAVIVVGNSRIGSLPPVVKFLDPYHGFWKNAETSADNIELSKALGLKQSAEVIFDDRHVPHVFAQNDQDLFFLQGYLTAKDRLWQMEFQTHAAAGRISELVGEKALEFDLEQRRIGMSWAAERALEFVSQDSTSFMILDSYTNGVNAYISQLRPDDYPIEYKLLDYKPEPWTMLKSCLLLKYMAKMLTGTERDLSNTEALKLLGEGLFSKLYPDQNYLDDPIVPGFSADTSVTVGERSNAYLSASDWESPYIQPHFVGSNNWAVSGSRTESGSAILCNDPHLKLSLPSIWYEIQLNSPTVNCYGVSLPGSPGITIGFNENIAWGVTNAGRDVKDYYAIKFDDENLASYNIGGKSYLAEKRTETIKVRGSKDVVELVPYTVYGPIAYSDEQADEHLALRWLAHDVSNELLTFYKLNRASNFEDYKVALSTYQCPGQNFVFADVNNNIAIWQHGKFKIKPKNYGRFILDGSKPEHLNERFIPQMHNPHMVNPERGFVSSANQAPTDTTYPYYYSGVFEEFRNRTINSFLRSDSSITIDEMKALQLNNFNLLAKEALPLMLEMLDTTKFQN